MSEVLVLVEHHDGAIAKVTGELLIAAARLGSPLAIGHGNNEMYLGSDAIALAPFTSEITYLEEGDWAVLRRKGATVDYSDPHVPVFPRMREHRFELSSVPLTPNAIASYDVVLVATAHSAFDYELVRQYANLIVDTRGVYTERLPNVVKA